MNIWKAMFLNKEESEDTKAVMANLNKIIDELQGKKRAAEEGKPIISKGWR